MPFIRGGSTFVLAGAHNLTSYTNNVSVNMDAGLVDDTVFGDTLRQYIQAGSKTANATISGFFDETSYIAQVQGSGSDDAMSDRVSSGPAGLMALTSTLQSTPGYAPLTLMWGGNTAGNPCFLGTILQATYDVGDTVGELISFSANFESGGAFEVSSVGAKATTQSAGFGRGFVLAPLAAYSSTGAAIGTTHDNSVPTFGPALLNFHCSLSGTGTTGTFRVEHSHDNTNWFTLGTFDNVTTTTGPFGQSLETGLHWADAVYRYLRAYQVATMTGNQTVAIAAARLGRAAVLLFSGTTVSTGAIGTVHDNGAATSNGAELKLNVVSAVGAGSATFRVEHSTDNFATSIVTLGTFSTTVTSATVNTAETVKTTGTVNRYVRAFSITAMGGGVTLSIMYARN
jgi:hypothetical protein